MRFNGLSLITHGCGSRPFVFAIEPPDHRHEDVRLSVCHLCITTRLTWYCDGEVEPSIGWWTHHGDKGRQESGIVALQDFLVEVFTYPEATLATERVFEVTCQPQPNYESENPYQGEAECAEIFFSAGLTHRSIIDVYAVHMGRGETSRWAHAAGCLHSAAPSSAIVVRQGLQRSLATCLYFRLCDGSYRNAMGRFLNPTVKNGAPTSDHDPKVATQDRLPSYLEAESVLLSEDLALWRALAAPSETARLLAAMDIHPRSPWANLAILNGMIANDKEYKQYMCIERSYRRYMQSINPPIWLGSSSLPEIVVTRLVDVPVALLHRFLDSVGTWVVVRPVLAAARLGTNVLGKLGPVVDTSLSAFIQRRGETFVDSEQGARQISWAKY